MNQSLTKADVQRRTIQTIADQLGLRVEKIKPEAKLVEDLDTDSLDHIEIIIALEDEFNLEIPDQEAEGWSTVQDCINTANKVCGV